jgi:hypothetical protein
MTDADAHGLTPPHQVRLQQYFNIENNYDFSSSVIWVYLKIHLLKFVKIKF